jgi:hypothetical protein
VLPYNQQITGNLTKFPLIAYYEKYFGPKTYALGFGPDRGIDWPIDAFPGHSPLEALINAALNTFSANVDLFGWSFGSLLIAGFYLLAGKKESEDYLLLALMAVVLVLYSLFWYSGGPDIGPRYWYLMILPLVVFTAKGILLLGDSPWRDKGSNNIQSARVSIVIIVLCLFSLVNYLPWRALDKYYHYLEMRPDIEQLADDYQFGKSIVLVQGKSHPDYASAWIYNPLLPDMEGPLFAYDQSLETRTQVINTFPDRSYWIVAGPSITGKAYQVVDGPLTSQQAATYPFLELLPELPE